MEAAKDLVLVVKPTLDGEVVVKKDGENLVQEPLSMVELEPLPKFFTQNHSQAMAMFHAFLLDLKQAHGQRKVPMTRTELFENGFDKKLYKDLIKAGLIKEKLVNLIREKDQKPTGARATVYYTPQGRAFIRTYIDPGYALTANT